MTWLTSFRCAGFVKTASLQDLITLFMVSRMPITTCRSWSFRTFSTKQGITTSSSFRSAVEEKVQTGKIRYICHSVQLCTILQRTMAQGCSFFITETSQQSIPVPKEKQVNIKKKKFTLMVGLCGTIFPCLVLSPAKLSHGSKCCLANVVMRILGIQTNFKNWARIPEHKATIKWVQCRGKWDFIPVLRFKGTLTLGKCTVSKHIFPLYGVVWTARLEEASLNTIQSVMGLHM